MNQETIDGIKKSYEVVTSSLTIGDRTVSYKEVLYLWATKEKAPEDEIECLIGFVDFIKHYNLFNPATRYAGFLKVREWTGNKIDLIWARLHYELTKTFGVMEVPTHSFKQNEKMRYGIEKQSDIEQQFFEYHRDGVFVFVKSGSGVRNPVWNGFSNDNILIHRPVTQITKKTNQFRLPYALQDGKALTDEVQSELSVVDETLLNASQALDESNVVDENLDAVQNVAPNLQNPDTIGEITELKETAIAYKDQLNTALEQIRNSNETIETLKETLRTTQNEVKQLKQATQDASNASSENFEQLTQLMEIIKGSSQNDANLLKAVEAKFEQAKTAEINNRLTILEQFAYKKTDVVLATREDLRNLIMENTDTRVKILELETANKEAYTRLSETKNMALEWVRSLTQQQTDLEQNQAQTENAMLNFAREITDQMTSIENRLDRLQTIKNLRSSITNQVENLTRSYDEVEAEIAKLNENTFQRAQYTARITNRIPIEESLRQLQSYGFLRMM